MVITRPAKKARAIGPSKAHRAMASFMRLFYSVVPDLISPASRPEGVSHVVVERTQTLLLCGAEHHGLALVAVHRYTECPLLQLLWCYGDVGKFVSPQQVLDKAGYLAHLLAAV